jgi:hypothetical protein
MRSLIRFKTRRKTEHSHRTSVQTEPNAQWTSATNIHNSQNMQPKLMSKYYLEMY